MSIGTHRLSLFFAFTTFSINHESKNLLLYELYTCCCITFNKGLSFYFSCKLKSDYFLLDMKNLYFFKILPEFLVNCRIRRFIFSAYFMSINFGDRNKKKTKQTPAPSPPLKVKWLFPNIYTHFKWFYAVNTYTTKYLTKACGSFSVGIFVVTKHIDINVCKIASHIF